MRVRTLLPHDNDYGDKYSKAVGDEYDHPAPGGLIEIGLVEEVGDAAAPDDGAEGVQGARKGAGRTAKSDQQERSAAGA
jgi:hypothetical protein